jgi:hypothetical protein
MTSDATVAEADSGVPVDIGETRKSSLSSATFAALLERLRSDELSSEAAYERLRLRLVAFLRLHLPVEAESLADVALDRLARRIHEGTIVDSVHLYALGIGRMLVLETQTRLGREAVAKHELALQPMEPSTDAEQEEALAAVTECLRRLGNSASDLILVYYSGDGAERIDKRQKLAAQLGISLNALRNRALRLRGLLERCARENLGANTAGRHLPRDTSPPGDT